MFLFCSSCLSAEDTRKSALANVLFPQLLVGSPQRIVQLLVPQLSLGPAVLARERAAQQQLQEEEQPAVLARERTVQSPPPQEEEEPHELQERHAQQTHTRTHRSSHYKCSKSFLNKIRGRVAHLRESVQQLSAEARKPPAPAMEHSPVPSAQPVDGVDEDSSDGDDTTPDKADNTTDNDGDGADESECGEPTELVVFPSIVEHGGTVELTWRGIKDVGEADWIGLFREGESNSSNYFSFFYVNKSETYRRGSGAVGGVTLFNVRHPLVFRYYRNDTSPCVDYGNGCPYDLVAESASVSFVGGPAAPTQVHLVPTTSPSEMRVNWVSGDLQSVPAQQAHAVPEVASSPSSVVCYWTTDPNKPLARAATRSTYSAADMCSAPATIVSARLFIPPGWLHDAVMTDLLPGTKYNYRVGSGPSEQCATTESGAWSQVFSFVTPPPADLSTARVRFAAVGDMGAYMPSSYQTIATLRDQLLLEDGMGRPDFILNLGDLSYARGNGMLWEEYMTLLARVAASSPMLIVVGNHDYDNVNASHNDPSGQPFYKPGWVLDNTTFNYSFDSSGECGVPMVKRFHMPDSGNSAFWYAVDWGMVKLVSISSEHDVRAKSPQYEWLQQTLASVNRTAQPWVVVMHHRPSYETERYPNDYVIAERLRESLDPLMLQYRVNLALHGHYHSYQRTCPVHMGACRGTYERPAATVHVTAGHAGHSLDVPGPGYPKAWSLNTLFEFGYITVDVTRDSMRVQAIRNSDGKVSDEFVLKPWVDLPSAEQPASHPAQPHNLPAAQPHNRPPAATADDVEAKNQVLTEIASLDS